MEEKLSNWTLELKKKASLIIEEYIIEDFKFIFYVWRKVKPTFEIIPLDLIEVVLKEGEKFNFEKIEEAMLKCIDEKCKSCLEDDANCNCCNRLISLQIIF